MSKDPGVDLSEDRLFFLGTTLLHKVVCAPKSWAGKQIEDAVSAEDPPGTSFNRWVVNDDPPEEMGGNPCECSDDPNRQHWLLSC